MWPTKVAEGTRITTLDTVRHTGLNTTLNRNTFINRNTFPNTNHNGVDIQCQHPFHNLVVTASTTSTAAMVAISDIAIMTVIMVEVGVEATDGIDLKTERA